MFSEAVFALQTTLENYLFILFIYLLINPYQRTQFTKYFWNVLKSSYIDQIIPETVLTHMSVQPDLRQRLRKHAMCEFYRREHSVAQALFSPRQ